MSLDMFLSPIDQKDMVCLHCKEGVHDKIYCYWVELEGPNSICIVFAAWGKASNPQAQAQNRQAVFNSLPAARRHIEALADVRRRKGYRNVYDYGYSGGLTFDEIAGKCSVHNLSQAEVGTPPPPIPTRGGMRTKLVLVTAIPTAHKAKRQLEA